MAEDAKLAERLAGLYPRHPAMWEELDGVKNKLEKSKR